MDGYRPPGYPPHPGHAGAGPPGYGPAAAPPGHGTGPGARPGAVTAGVAVLVATAVLTVVGGGLAMVLLIQAERTGDVDLFPGAGIVLGGGLLVVGLAQLLLAVGLLRGSFGCWVATMAVLALNLVLTIGFARGFGIPLLALYATVVVLLAIPASRGWFTAVRDARRY